MAPPDKSRAAKRTNSQVIKKTAIKSKEKIAKKAQKRSKKVLDAERAQRQLRISNLKGILFPWM
jgi:hypothetical protein